MDTAKRSFIKSVSYRVFASIVTAGLVFLFTHRFLLAVSMGILDSTLKVGVYFLHERIWQKIAYGRQEHPLQTIKVRRPLTGQHQREVEAKLQELGYLGEHI